MDVPENLPSRTAGVGSDLYEELLDRYERVLVFAGQLQERARQQKLLAEKNDSLEKENDRLKQVVAAQDSYVRLLEHALAALGILKPAE